MSDLPQTVKDLKPSEYNPRVMSEKQHEQLAASMERFGDLSGVVFNRRSGTLVGAHQRTKHMPPDATIVLHGERTPPNEQGTVATGYIDVQGERWQYREVDVDDMIEKAMNLSANKNTGSWVDSALTDLLRGMDHEMPIGFDDVEIAKILNQESLELEEILAEDQSITQYHSVLVKCDTEATQVELLERLTAEGMECKALIL